MAHAGDAQSASGRRLCRKPKAANMSLAAQDDEPDPTLVCVRVAPWMLPLLGAAIALGTASIGWTVLSYA